MIGAILVGKSVKLKSCENSWLKSPFSVWRMRTNF